VLGPVEVSGLPAGTELPCGDVTGEPPPPGVVLAVLCVGLAVDDVEGLLETDGLAEDGVVFGAFVLLGLACVLAQGPWLPDALALAVAFADAVGLADAVDVADTDAVDVAVLLAPALAVLLALPLPVAGLVGEPGGVTVGVTGGVAEVLARRGEVVFGVAEGVGEDSEHDASGVGAWRFAAVVCAPAAPPLPSACPPPAAAAARPELADDWPLSTPDTDEATTWRSGGTEAITTPTINTAQPTAMAGLSSAIRQSLARRA
jgi:hypothetical protein